MARDALKEKIATYEQGVTIRKHETEEAKISAAKDEAELSKLKSEEKVLKGIVEQLKGMFNVFLHDLLTIIGFPITISHYTNMYC